MANALPSRFTARIVSWANLWDVPNLPGVVTIRTSTRLRTRLGWCRPGTGEITIAAFLLEAPEALLDEVVCHELAHLAARMLHGEAIRPHGPEWKQLMRTAGHAPRPRLTARELATLPADAQRARVRWEHRCPSCHASRTAGRPVRQWRCTRCLAGGSDGTLTITRHPAHVRNR